MYSFQTGAGKRKNKQTVRILSVVIFVLVIALAGVTFSYIRVSGGSRTTNDALMARATSEANEAQSAVYRLTQSSGTNTMTLLANVRSHIYALQCLNTLASNIYGAGTIIVDNSMLTDCMTTLDAAEQAGSATFPHIGNRINRPRAQTFHRLRTAAEVKAGSAHIIT